MTSRCPHCQATFAVDDDADAIQTCPNCQTSFNVRVNLNSVNLQPGTELGGYRIVRKLAVGGMSQVYLARQLSLARDVALKVLPLPDVDREPALHQFLLEVRSTAALQHPGIVTAFEAGAQDGICYLAMHFVDGESLDQLIERSGKLIDEPEALRIALHVARAMAYAWNKEHLLHRDLKPANIMVDRAGEVRLLDLGIARRPTDRYQLTHTGIPIGTPHFMSPEQARGVTDLDCRADIYSLGVTLYQITTGECPFDGCNSVEVMTRHLTEPLPPPTQFNPKLSQPFCHLLESMLAKQRHDRPADWDALIEDLECVIAGEPPLSAAAPPPLPPPSPSPPAASPAADPAFRALVATTVLLLLLVILLGALAISLARQNQPRRGPAVAEEPVVPPLAAVPPEAVPTAPPDDQTLASQVADRCRRQDDPNALAEPWVHQGRLEVADRYFLNILVNPAATHPDWRRGAARGLVASRRQQGQEELLDEALLQLAALCEGDDPPAAIAAYREVADRMRGTDPAAAAELMHRVWRDSRDDTRTVPAAAAEWLAGHYRATGDAAMLQACLEAAAQELPDHLPFRRQAARLLAELPAVQPPAPALPAPELTPIASLQERLSMAADDDARAILTLRLADAYAEAGDVAAALDTLQRAADRHEGLQQGLIAGQARLKAARLLHRQGRTAEAIATLERLLEAGPLGPDNELGFAVCRELAELVRQTGDDARHLALLERAAADYPAANREAVEALRFELARLYERRRDWPRLVGLLQAMRQAASPAEAESPAQNRLRGEIRRLYATYPAELLPLAVPNHEARFFSPFELVLDFGGAYAHLEVRERTTALNRATSLTVEAWVRPRQHSQAVQYLASRCGNNQRGFNLGLIDGQAVWVVYDGRQEYRIVSPDRLPEQAWSHLAATIGQGSMALFVNGRQVAAADSPGVDNDGAGRLRLGRASWMDGGHFRGFMQQVRVVDRVLYPGAFQPRLEAPLLPGTLALIVPAEAGPVDQTGNTIVLHTR